MSESNTDYIVAGGGLCGCVVASRLRRAGHSVILIESGPQDSKNPAVLAAGEAFTMAFTNPQLLYQYSTSNQEALHGRRVGVQAGRVLGGGSTVDYAAWTRGHRANYDGWARIVNDPRWSYDELLPFFKKSESYCDLPDSGHTTAEQHGFEGPIKVCSGPRGYPLREQTRDALLQAGFELNPDGNSGNPNGITPLIESWKNGIRQFTAENYDLSGIKILSNSHVAILILESRNALGVELVNGSRIYASKEVILSCGAVRTPQVLMLSGIGPKAELQKHGIPLVLDLPVGENLMDHGALHIAYHLRDPERGYAVGSEGFSNPRFFEGAPIDWLTFGSAPDKDLARAAAKDGVQFQSGPRCDFEISSTYAPGPPAPGFEPLPMDGTSFSLSLCCVSPTSRGSVTLQNTDAEAHPVVDPAYFSTEHDLAIMRAAMRSAFRVAESKAGQTFLTEERPPPTLPKLSSASTDAELDARLKACSTTFNHLAGTAAMGSVTDSHCRVKDISNLRVIDASILPISINAHPQAPLYAVAESAADMLLVEN